MKRIFELVVAPRAVLASGRTVAWVLGAVLASAACSDPAAAPPDDSGGAAGAAGNPSSGGASSASAGAAGAPSTRAHTAGCVAPAGVSTTPQTIAETVALLNSLPKPVTLPCFIESLAHPLRLYATNSQISAQPAVGLRSPRVFLFMGVSMMSVALDGMGQPLLEFGEARPNFRSLKAELHFPITTTLAPGDPYVSPMFSETGTSCAFCHAEETIDTTLGGLRGFISQSLRPFATEEVPLPGLQYELQICNRAQEPERCALLDSLFGWGPVSNAQFPEGMATMRDDTLL